MGALPNSVMSAPAINVLPSHIITIELTALSLIAASTPLFKPSLTLAERALTGGELSVITATESVTSRLVTSLTVSYTHLTLPTSLIV